jgi:hypothetical protein
MMEGRRGICVEWDNPQKTIIRWDFYDWTWEDFHAAAQQTLDMFAAANRTKATPSILNLKHSGSVPLGAIPNSRIELDMMAEDSITVIAEASGYANTLTRLFVRLHPKARGKVFVVDTLEQARAFIAKQKPT